MYGRELVDLRNESRWEFLNTFFSVSEAVAYMQVTSLVTIGLFPFAGLGVEVHLMILVLLWPWPYIFLTQFTAYSNPQGY